MEELNRTERFKEVANKLRTFTITDKQNDAFSGVHQISFRLPNSESDNFHIFKYSSHQEFLEDLQSLDLASPIDRTNEAANHILNGLGVDKNNTFSLEMY